jgi:hypothetical protein
MDPGLAVTPIPSSATIWLMLTPGDTSIATASRLYSAENFHLCPMTPVLAHYGPNLGVRKTGVEPAEGHGQDPRHERDDTGLGRRNSMRGTDLQ